MNSKFRDDEVLRYLETHTYDETMIYFKISRMTVSRIKKRNKVQIMPQKINLAIVGVGNAASALIQGIEYYKARNNNIGLLHPTLAGYHISDIDVVAAFDISSKKVGKYLHHAIVENEFPLQVSIPELEIKVLMGEILDGVIDETRNIISPSQVPPVDVEKSLKESNAEIMLCLLPSGADTAVRYYANMALKAGCAFINATPSTIAGDKEYARKFNDAGLPLIGDDLQDQYGATIVHKMILQQMLNQGVHIKESYALDVGGGA